MLLLAIDTSGKQGSIALARGREDGPCEVVEVVLLAGGTFSAQLVPQIASLLSKHGFTKNHIDAFAVASGPGSFTGLRVGLAAIKALAEVLKKPIAAVPVLEALAVASGLRGKVLAVLDAGRGDVYLGDYDVSEDSAQLKHERLSGMAESLAVARGRRVVTTDERLAEILRVAGLSVSTIEPLCASEIARVGWRKLRQGATVSPEELEANYIRRSDAEIFAKSRS
jgi:tRNA threonylcarbamoyladenosine biosynthesis protein TsaB